MELRELTTFITVAQSKSFSKAATILNYSQAAVTIQVRHLEKEFGIQLFDRLGKQISLTNRGLVFYTYACRILNIVSEATEAVAASSELTGSLNIGTIDSLCSSYLPALLSDYHYCFPRVTISVTTDTPSVLFDMMNQNELDLVYLLDEKITDGRWKKVAEMQDEIVFTVSSKHPLAREDFPSLDTVLSYPFLLTEKDASYRKLLDKQLLLMGRQIKPFLQARNTDLLIYMISDNMGVSFLPRFSIEDKLSDGSLVALNVPDFPMKIWHQLLHHKDKWITKEMKTFFNLITKQLSKNI